MRLIWLLEREIGTFGYLVVQIQLRKLYAICAGIIQNWGQMDTNLHFINGCFANDAGIAYTGHQYCSLGAPTKAALKVLLKNEITRVGRGHLMD